MLIEEQVSGGLDTMVNTLAWTVGTLVLRPDIQDKAYQAIVEAYGNSWGPVEDENGVPVSRNYPLWADDPF